MLTPEFVYVLSEHIENGGKTISVYRNLAEAQNDWRGDWKNKRCNEWGMYCEEDGVELYYTLVRWPIF